MGDFPKSGHICQSCCILFHSTNTEEPFDLVVARKECCLHKTQGGETKIPSAPSNSHYHVSMQCICVAEPMCIVSCARRCVRTFDRCS